MYYHIPPGPWVNTLRPRQNGRHFADDIFKCIFLNENVWIPIKISLKFVPISTIPSLVQIMVWRRPGANPLSEPMMVSLLTHICVTRPQWVNILMKYHCINHPNYNATANTFHFNHTWLSILFTLDLNLREICCNICLDNWISLMLLVHVLLVRICFYLSCMVCNFVSRINERMYRHDSNIWTTDPSKQLLTK